MNIATWIVGVLYGSKAKTAFEGTINTEVATAIAANPALTADGAISALEPKLNVYLSTVTAKFPGWARAALTLILDAQFEQAVRKAFAALAPKPAAS